MARNIAQTNVEQAKLLANQLQDQHGVDHERINDWLNQPGAVDKILQDFPLLEQYLRTSQRGLNDIDQWNFEDRSRSMSGEVDGPGSPRYLAFFDPSRDTSGGVVGRDYVPENLLFGPDQSNLVSQGWMTPDQYQWFLYFQQNQVFTNGGGQQQQGTAQGGTPPPGGAKAYSTRGAPQPGPGTGGPSAPGGPKFYSSGPAPKYLGGETPAGGPPPPPPPGGFPPPPTGPGPGLGGPGAGGQWVHQGVIDYVAGLENGPQRDMLIGLLGDENMSNGVIANIISQMESDRMTMDYIRNTIAGLNPEDPQQRHQITVMNMEMQEVSSRMQRGYDYLNQARRFVTERETLVKGLMDIMFRAKERIAANFRIGG